MIVDENAKKLIHAKLLILSKCISNARIFHLVDGTHPDAALVDSFIVMSEKGFLTKEMLVKANELYSKYKSYYAIDLGPSHTLDDDPF